MPCLAQNSLCPGASRQLVLRCLKKGYPQPGQQRGQNFHSTLGGS